MRKGKHHVIVDVEPASLDRGHRNIRGLTFDGEEMFSGGLMRLVLRSTEGPEVELEPHIGEQGVTVELFRGSEGQRWQDAEDEEIMLVWLPVLTWNLRVCGEPVAGKTTQEIRQLVDRARLELKYRWLEEVVERLEAGDSVEVGRGDPQRYLPWLREELKARGLEVLEIPTRWSWTIGYDPYVVLVKKGTEEARKLLLQAHERMREGAEEIGRLMSEDADAAGEALADVES